MQIIWTFAFLAIAFVMPATAAQSPQLFVVTFEKGERWVDSIRYEKQPDLKDHIEYWQSLYLKEILLMSGPFEDQSGGLFFIRAASLDVVNELIRQDPGIRAGVITASAQKWRILTSAMRSVKPQRIEVEPDRSFRVERVDPDSPINLPQN